MKHTNCYIKDYPRPQFVRREWENLNGEWKFAFDDTNTGEQNNWNNGFASDVCIQVPFSYQTKASGLEIKERHDHIWYSREIDFDKTSERRILLNFEGSDYTTKVWVNGLYVGRHDGGYTRFSFDITNAVSVSDGPALVVVKCEDSYDATQPRGKQKWLKNPFGCWYTETNGMWKSVWAEYVSEVHLKSVKMTPNVDTFCMDMEAEVSGVCKNLTLTTEVSFGGRFVTSQTVGVGRDKFSFSTDMSCDGEPFKTRWWKMGDPALYDIVFTLRAGDTVLDTVGSYAGFRIFQTKKDGVVLNLWATYLKMVLEQGYTRDSGLTFPSEDAIVAELKTIQELGFNGVRVHQKIEDERFFYYADIMGIATWVEMPSTYEFRDAAVEKITGEWMQVVRQHYNHPSVLAWVPINESWGVSRILTSKREQHFSEALYYLTKAYDDMRPVISNDGWEHTKSDIITLHNYCQDPEKLYEFYKDIDRVLNNESMPYNSQGRLTFCDGYKYEGQPVMITEFAGIGYKTNGDDGWGYGDKVQNDEQFYRRLKELVRVVRENPRVSGYCITQITDVEAEINGLLDFDRNIKIDKQKMKDIVSQ